MKSSMLSLIAVPLFSLIASASPLLGIKPFDEQPVSDVENGMKDFPVATYNAKSAGKCPTVVVIFVRGTFDSGWVF